MDLVFGKVKGFIMCYKNEFTLMFFNNIAQQE